MSSNTQANWGGFYFATLKGPATAVLEKLDWEMDQ